MTTTERNMTEMTRNTPESSRVKAKREAATKGKRAESGSLVRCPACGNKVVKIDRSALMATGDEMNALIARRRADRSHDLAERRDAAQLASYYGALGGAEPEPGDDTCPGCGTEGVEIVEPGALSPTGQMHLLASRSRASSLAVAEIVAAKSARSRAKLAAHNERQAKKRAALRGDQ